MTTTASTNYWPYEGDGSETEFTYDNLILASSDLYVYVGGTLQTENSDYTVSGAGANSGGTVTFTAAPADGAEIMLFRDPARLQTTSYGENDDFPASVTNTALDRLNVQVQAALAKLSRCLRLTDYDKQADFTGEIPAESARAEKWLYFDADGEPTAVAASATNSSTELANAEAGALAAQVAAETAQSAAETAQTAAEAAQKTLVGVNAQTGTSYTLVLTDAGKIVTMSNASANTLTVPPNSSVAFEVGTVIEVSQNGAGTTTIAAGGGVTLRSELSLLDIANQYGVVALAKIATDEWIVSGSLA